ncbi:MAG TPA: class I SAM-dependent methyltransferase [Acidimicrobiales bacterium]|nr:class I SAM-dependent methyltransferase [Acidimicrobiales bacterium]
MADRIPRPTDFDSTLRTVADVRGWMTDDQARLLWDRASGLSDGAQIVEIGSFQGRSTIVLATAAPDGTRIVAIDPHAGNDRGPQEIEGFQREAEADHETFLANLEGAGVRQRVHHVRKFSDAAHPDVDGEIDLLYIDGAHRYAPARNDIAEWGARVRPGGTMLIHDSFSSVGVTLAIVRELFFSRRFRYVGRAQSMTEYRAEPVAGAGHRVRNALHQIAQLGWFARNVVIKALIVAHLGRFTRYLGHPSADWPY